MKKILWLATAIFALTPLSAFALSAGQTCYTSTGSTAPWTCQVQTSDNRCIQQRGCDSGMLCCQLPPANPGATCYGNNSAKQGTCAVQSSCSSANTDTSGNCFGGLICCSYNPATGGNNNPAVGGTSCTATSCGTGYTCDSTSGQCVTNPTDASSGGTSVSIINPLGSGATLNTFLDSIMKLVIQIGSVVVVLMFIYVGWMFVIAQGQPAAISEAKKALTWTIIGALVLLGAQAIADGIQATVQALSVGK